MTPSHQHCDHECVCPSISQVQRSRKEPCTVYECPHDTRSHPSPAPTDGMTEEQRKYILSFREEDPLLMAYVEGQKNPSPEQKAAIVAATRKEVIEEIWEHIKGHSDPMTDDYFASLRGTPSAPEQEEQR